MSVIVLNHPSSAGLLPTPPPSCRLLPYNFLPATTTSSTRRPRHDDPVIKPAKGYSWNHNSSCNRSPSSSSSSSPSSSPPRRSHKKYRAAASTTTNKEESFYGGACFFTSSPPPDSLPLPTFLKSGGGQGGEIATDQNRSGRRQYSREQLLSLCKSGASSLSLPPGIDQSLLKPLIETKPPRW